ncbi:MAG TPA: hypothetical protein VH208_07275 [Myxococcaceae bacterium]|nr:hypothetical protein [Myxococcaceae bacterium]
MKVLIDATLCLVAEHTGEQAHPVLPLPQPPDLHRVKPQRAKLPVVNAPVLVGSDAKGASEQGL